VEAVVAHETESAVVHAEARNAVAEVVELSEDDGETQSADLTLTASAFAEPRLTAEDFDAFAPEPQFAPQSIPKGDEHSPFP
jgi:hypothetical protein